MCGHGRRLSTPIPPSAFPPPLTHLYHHHAVPSPDVLVHTGQYKLLEVPALLLEVPGVPVVTPCSQDHEDQPLPKGKSRG